MSLSRDPAEKSPSLLSGPPKRGAGVRRLNRLPIAFAIGGAMLVVAAIGYTYHARLMQSAANADKAAQQKPAPGNGAAVLSGAPAGGEVISAVLRTPSGRRGEGGPQQRRRLAVRRPHHRDPGGGGTVSLSPDPPDRSPSLLSGPPKRGVGVRRLNRLPIAFAIGGAMLVVAAIGYTYHARLMQSAANADKAAQQKPAPGNGAAVLSGAPAGGEVIPAVLRTQLPAGSAQGRPASPLPTLPADGNAAGGQPSADDDAAKARREAWQAYYAELAQLRKDRLAAATSAMTADTGMSSSNGSGTQPVTPGAGTATPAALTGADATAGEPGRGPGAPGFVPAVQPGGFGLPLYPPARVDTSAQREKQAFLSQPGDVTGNSDDLQATLRDPSSPFLVMAGTAIPAVMIGGINSDMPGMVIGQVSTNVYDTATGRYLLIPQGARLIGSYDNMVANGQTRVGVIWNRIIYPDTEFDRPRLHGGRRPGRLCRLP